MIWLATACVAACWVVCARLNPALVFPVYVVASLLPTPWSGAIQVYPDLGLGGLVKTVPSAGDVLLAATAVAHPRVRAHLRQPGVPQALSLLSGIALVVSLHRDDLPTATAVFLAAVPLRMGLAMAVMRSGLVAARSLLPTLASITVVAAMMWAAAGVLVAAQVTGLVSGTPLSHLVGSDGRLAFPTLGNNKIGLALLMLTGAIGFLANRLEHRWAPGIFPTAVACGLLTTTVAQIRFATTAFAIVLLVWAMQERRRRRPTLLISAAVAVVGIRLGAAEHLRALAVLTGGFDASSDSSLGSRWDLWTAALNIWEASPAFGHLGQWEFARPVDRLDLLAPLEPHSEVMWTLASLGILGIAALAATVVPVLRLVWQRPLAAESVCAALALGAMLLNTASFFPVSAWALAALSAVAWWSRTQLPTHGPVPPAPPTVHDAASPLPT